MSQPVVLITGAARRVGAVIARRLHAEGMNLVLHYRSSRKEAQLLQKELQARRPESVVLIQADLLQVSKSPHLVKEAAGVWGRLDALINNAATFYPTSVGNITEAHWDDLFGVNLKAPLFLSQAAAPYLAKQKGSIINITDIHAERPLKSHSVYCAAKAGLVMLTQSLAQELGPDVRTNAIAPGAIMWPEEGMDEFTKRRIISKTALKRHGDPEDIAEAVYYLLHGAQFMTGQVLTVDGGRSLGN